MGWDIETDWGFGTTSAYSEKPQTKPKAVESSSLSERLLRMNARSLEIHTQKVRSLCDLTPLPVPGEQYLIVTNKSYNALTFIDFILRTETPREIHMAVYRINMFAVQRITEILDQFPELTMMVMVSNFFNSNARAEAWAEQLKRLGEEHDRIDVAFAPSHAKVFCCLTERGAHYVFEGSGNLSDNARIEQYRYEDNREVYDFHTQWIDETIEANR